MSGTSLNAGLPSAPLIDPASGDISQPWRLFMLALQRRTGSANAPAVGVSTAAETTRALAAEAALRAAIQAAGGIFVFTQATPATVWPIIHNLNRHPAMAVSDSAGTFIEGDIFYNSTNTVTLTFAAPFSGTAYCI